MNIPELRRIFLRYVENGQKDWQDRYIIRKKSPMRASAQHQSANEFNGIK
ncbi:MAG: hypothetical protein LUQ26_07680 [Methylococcaceae bacterium]|nr:hypothetical protein [Methylococcaceae bacterium]